MSPPSLGSVRRAGDLQVCVIARTMGFLEATMHTGTRFQVFETRPDRRVLCTRKDVEQVKARKDQRNAHIALAGKGEDRLRLS